MPKRQISLSLALALCSVLGVFAFSIPVFSDLHNGLGPAMELFGFQPAGPPVDLSTINSPTTDNLVPQSDQTWSGDATGNGSAWYTTTNWAGGAFPGSSSGVTTNTDIATIPSTGTTNPNATIGVNMSTPIGNVHYLGAINYTGTVDRAIGDSSTAASGVLQLNGATINGVNNVILRHTGTSLFTVQPIASGNGMLSLALGNPTDNIINLDGSGSLTISSVISGAGKKLTLNGAGTGVLTLSGVNTYTGPTTISGGILNINSIANGGVASSLGASTNAAASLVFDGGTLKCSSVASGTTNRNFTINNGKTAIFDVGPKDLTINGASTATTGGLTKTGAGSLFLSGANLYSGNTVISGVGGALILTVNGSIANSSQIEIGGGAIFDIGTLATAMTLPATQSLKASGTTSSGIIAVSATKGLTTASGTTIQFSAFNGSVAPLAIQGAGSITLASTNSVIVNTTSALGIGNYTLIAKSATGSVIGSAPANLTIGGSGLAPGTAASLLITGSQLILHVVADNTLTNDFFRSKASGNWGAVSTWESSHDNSTWISATAVPTSSASATVIKSGHTVIVAVSTSSAHVTVQSGALLSVGAGITFDIGNGLTVDNGGMLTTAGNVDNISTAQINGTVRIDTNGYLGPIGTWSWDQTTGVLIFNHTAGLYVFNGEPYWPTINGPQTVILANSSSDGIHMGGNPRTVGVAMITSATIQSASDLTLNGLFQINAGGFVSGSPTFGPLSTLKYNTGGTYGRAGEWFPGTTSGAGYPHDVQISNNTTLNLPNGSTGVFFQMSGTLNVDTGSQLDMIGASPMSMPLRVLGGVNNNGTITLSTTDGGDLHIGGDWTHVASGVLNSNGRPVYFDAAGDQTIFGDNTWDGLIISASAARTIKFEAGKMQTTNVGLSITGTAGGVISLRSTTDAIPWKVSAMGGATVLYADVRDSDATGGATISATNSDDSGNNLNWIFLSPTAAEVSISGRILTAAGEGIPGAPVTVSGGGLTSPTSVRASATGDYRFDRLRPGLTYIISVRAKHYVFTNPARPVLVTDDVANFDFIAQP